MARLPTSRFSRPIATSGDGVARLDQRITLRRPAGFADGAGGRQVGWHDFASNASVWAAVEPLGGNEAAADGRVAATAMHRFTIRYRIDVNETHGILWNGEHYNIRRVMREGGRKLYLMIEAERGAPK